MSKASEIGQRIEEWFKAKKFMGLVFTKLALPDNEIQNLKLLGLIVADQVFTSIRGGSGLKKTCHLEPWN